ncbi:uncharacterized protein LOC119591115 [Penaeus monodon]|uniref:uncharacterized protein LOC119591115 n=1 Tax=Penaeus monodon TaxID=6687 RepID=UPI0018A73C32|nr:uncharacterized protein LOC119591115 [Penaeus monodon]
MLMVEAGADTKFIKSGTILATLDRSLVLCAGHCSAVFSCLAFNYQPSSRLCELRSAVPYSTSDPAMTANPGWSFYFMGLPEGDPCKNSGCPETSMCLTYEQPVALRPYDPTLPTFTCAANPWFLEQRKLGYRECRFKVQYNMHFRGSVVTNNNRNLAYYDSLQTCLQLSCLSLCCDEIKSRPSFRELAE